MCDAPPTDRADTTVGGGVTGGDSLRNVVGVAERVGQRHQRALNNQQIVLANVEFPFL